MIIHLTGSARNIEEDIVYFRQIARIIHENNGLLARDWAETVHHNRTVKKIPDEKVDWKTVMADSLDAVSRSDAIIIEATNYTFSQGFQTAMALQKKKPVLLVSRNKITDRVISGYEDPNLTIAEYGTLHELQRIITSFLQNVSLPKDALTQSVVLDREIYDYLEKSSSEIGSDPSSLLLELARAEMRRRDVH